MAFTPAYPSATNTFIPTMNEEATAGLVVNFSRNPNTFALPRWASYTPVKKWTGLWLRMNIDQCARILDAKGNNNVWARGQDAPELTWNLESFAWQQFFTTRFLYGYQLPREAEQQADFSVVSQQNAVEAMRAMTQRTQIAVTKATDTTQYDSSHVKTATVWSGGYIGSGTPTAPYYKILLETMYQKIHLDSRGTIRPDDVVVVINPAQAQKIAQSQEVHTYLKESPSAWPQLTTSNPGQSPRSWGIPANLYGFQHVVEDSVKNPNAKGATSQAGEYIWPWDYVGMFARPGGLIAPEGAMSFSTIHVFLLEDMAVEQFDDPINRRTTSRFCDDFGVEVVAPVSGCLATSALASNPSAALFTPDGGFGGTGPTGVPVSDAATPGGQTPEFWANAGKFAEMESRVSQLSTLVENLRTENQRLQAEAVARNPEAPQEGAPGESRRRK